MYQVLPWVYRILKPTFPQCLWSGKPGRQQVALTFDDGPHPRHTKALLEVLRRHGVVASFFWLGIQVQRYPAVARAVSQQGHWLGLHGYQHINFVKLSKLELYESLQKTQDAIAAACAINPHQVIDVRPPNGLFAPHTLDWLQQWHYRPVMWSVVPMDWTQPGVAVVVQRVLQQVKDGAVIVLHDGTFGGTDVAEITDRLVGALLQRGYELVTVDRLWRWSFGAVPKAPSQQDVSPPG
ncbi:polysaccharide deacetylase family protein [Geitlerinema sp. PCC 9228]|jgi:peptidoglycan/xylan/chitin deacetylase (PgdA/CDA1 family)|uniref:polysaccharide deacetylase family protein n=1 Tax=Geitlerinema sp. PCC 9228 TaxID=111611 RepID=UPI0008F9B000|nr:polysaccharide deacetylase family protein [Geitlerinema sp. PCC 9228]